MATPLRSAPSLPPEADEEAPLDPAVERVRQRLKRLILVSIATLALGLAAVVVAVLYKVGPVRDKGVLDARAGIVAAEAALPAGARIVSTALDGRMLAVTFEDGGRSMTVIVDIDSGRVLRQVELRRGAPVTP